MTHSSGFNFVVDLPTLTMQQRLMLSAHCVFTSAHMSNAILLILTLHNCLCTYSFSPSYSLTFWLFYFIPGSLELQREKGTKM